MTVIGLVGETLGGTPRYFDASNEGSWPSARHAAAGDVKIRMSLLNSRGNQIDYGVYVDAADARAFGEGLIRLADEAEAREAGNG